MTEMALWVCRRCSTRFAVGLSMCPQCTSIDCYEEDGAMPKATKHGGGSIAGEVVHSDVAGTGDAVNAATGEVTPAGEPLPEVESGWDAFKVDELKAELAERGLSTSGKKAELVARLTEDDAQAADGGEGDDEDPDGSEDGGAGDG